VRAGLHPSIEPGKVLSRLRQRRAAQERSRAHNGQILHKERGENKSDIPGMTLTI
jgi:hypothetical protein